MIGPKGETVSVYVLSVHYAQFFFNYLQTLGKFPFFVVSHSLVLPFLWQGPRGPDGDPGPQGVAGATVS